MVVVYTVLPNKYEFKMYVPVNTEAEAEEYLKRSRRRKGRTQRIKIVRFEK